MSYLVRAPRRGIDGKANGAGRRRCGAAISTECAEAAA
jgi:hypothetical protein